MRGFAYRDNRGFSLIEMAFVLIIAGIIISMGVQLLPMLVRQHTYTDANNRIQEARTALIGYALANGKLPWAAAATNGVATNNRRRGYLPYATLGIKGTDPYNNPNPIYYAVDQNLPTTTSTATFKTMLTNLISTSTLPTPALHCNANAGGSPAGTTDAAFVVLSVGPNKTVDSPNSMAAAGTATFESPGAPQTASYDDVLDSVSLTYLLGRLP